MALGPGKGMYSWHPGRSFIWGSPALGLGTFLVTALAMLCLAQFGSGTPQNGPVPESACSTTVSTSPQGSLGAGSQWGRGESSITHRGHLFGLDTKDGPEAWTISTLLNSTGPISV